MADEKMNLSLRDVTGIKSPPDEPEKDHLLILYNTQLLFAAGFLAGIATKVPKGDRAHVEEFAERCRQVAFGEVGTAGVSKAEIEDCEQ